MNSSFEELFFFLLLLVFDIASTWSRLDYFYLIGSDKNLFYGLNYKTGWMSLKKKSILNLHGQKNIEQPLHYSFD